MKKCLLLFSSLLFAGTMYGQAPIGDTIYWDKNWNVTTRQGHEYFRTSELDTVTMAPTRLVKIIDRYKDGKVQMDGYVLAEDTSKNVGLHRWFKTNGDLMEVTVFDYKAARKYFESTAPYFNKAEVCDSSKIDLFITFFKGNKVKSMSFLRSGKEFDTCKCNRICIYKEYSSIGKKIYETWEYKNGLPDGYYRYYHTNGTIWEEGYYKQGNKTDWKKVYRYNGSLRKEKGTAPKQ